MSPTRRWLLYGAMALVGAFALRALSGVVWPADWQRHQRRYGALEVKAGRAAPALGIRATSPTPGAGSGERCVSCHLGMALGQGHAEAPLRAHPPHRCARSVATLGCVGCHGGEGASLEAARAHGLRGRGSVALLAYKAKDVARRALLQAGCASCHHRRVMGRLAIDERAAPEVAAGQALYLAHGCAACHRLGGMHHGGELGPALDGVGQRTDRHQLRAKLRGPTAPMPALTLDARRERQLLTFLLAQRGALASAMTRPPTIVPLLAHFGGVAPPSSAAAGALWARRVGCLGCHRLGDSDRGVPDLRRIAWVRDGRSLAAALESPAKQFAGTRMPAVRSAELRAALLAWLKLQRTPMPSGPPAQIFRAVCAPCHGPKADPGRVVLAKTPPALRGGGKLTRARFVETLRKGRPGTAMAPWGRLFGESFLHGLYRGLPSLPTDAAKKGGAR
jgi:mono/diheme cytochrome c family protein